MRRISHRLIIAAVLGAAVLTVTAAPQAALADTARASDGSSVLVMTVTADTPDAPDAIRTAVLECGDRAAGDHPAPTAACAALEADGLDFTAAPAQQIMCSDLVQPVTVSAIGVWNGSPVDYQQTYPNACQMLRATGLLFNF